MQATKEYQKIHNIHLTCWNVNGLRNKGLDYNKLHDDNFLKCIEEFDIVGLVETHSDIDEVLNIPGYSAVTASRPKSKKARKSSGGTAVFIKNTISKGVSHVKSPSNKFIWLKLCRNFFNLQQDTFVAVIYIPPGNSTFLRSNECDLIGALEGDVQHFSKLGGLILLGDFNGRTATEPDSVISDSVKHGPSTPDYILDQCLTTRLNQDVCLNERGKAILDLCVSARLRILNGRKLGDSLGFFTCHKYNGSSTVDYALVNENMLSDILYFHVHNSLSDISDHCQISVGLKCTKTYINSTPKVPFVNLPSGFKWSKDSTFKFQKALLAVKSQDAIKAFLNTSYGESEADLDRAALKVNEIITEAAKTSLKRKVKQRRTKTKKAWYTTGLDQLRKELKDTGYKLCLYPRDTILRGHFFSTQRRYRKACKQERRRFKNKLLYMLDELESNDPKEYWNLVKKIAGSDKGELSHLDPDLFYQHYKDLNNREVISSSQNAPIFAELESLEQTPIFNELDNRITEKEVTKSLRLLKNGKASGVDLISNEMLKAGSTILLPVLCKIFNLTLSNGHFPSTWAQGHIMSIHKKGDINDPSNYRGITLSSCLGKLFNGVLNSRLYDFLVSRNIIRQEQIGFRKGHRTTDHLFIINNLIKKYKKSRKSLFMCFVDFQKAFDSVWHLGLFTKLKRIGISSRFYSVIKSLYSKSSISVQIGNRLSPYFQSRIGVRQGDNLSPTLFNIFVNDLPPIFDQTCSPASFGDLHLQCLLYADDLVLFSETEEGLQHSLDKLKDYCNLWSLDINVSKTKVMCCGKVSSQRRFFSGTEQLQMVTSYKYLGLELHESGDLQVARKDLSRRALKAFYGISRHFSNHTKVSTVKQLIWQCLVNFQGIIFWWIE